MKEIYELLQQWSIKAAVAQSLLEASSQATSNLMITNRRLHKLCEDRGIDMNELIEQYKLK